MDVAFIGAGGVGGYFGGLLARKGVGVHFVARGQHLSAIRREGLRIEAASGTFTVRPASAEADARAVGRCDFAFVCVKNYDLDAAIEALRPFAGERACFVPLLNGVDAVDKLGAAFPRRTVAGQCSVLAEVAAPGVIRQAPGPQQIVVGELDRRLTSRVAALADVFAGTGVDLVVSESIQTALWTKAIYIACLASVIAATRTSAREVLACAESRALYIAALREAVAVADKEGVTLEPNLVQTLLARGEALQAGTKLSLLRDFEANRRTEIESLSGSFIRRGRARGVPTPTHEFLYAVLLPAHLRGCAGV
ncbi:ketopantoate reductase family protein [Pendulispora albinea]|uniref:2-dehydropantoate 2-reductase n=1 Tax=Pendulispora albinea TaxID=2741071 RepID=A0ABZ2LS42_9BACT